MSRQRVVFAVIPMLFLLALGCSGGGGTPASPSIERASDQVLTSQTDQASRPGANLWGYYDIYLDLETNTIQAVPSRSTEFAANVVKFLNNDPQGLKVKSNGVTPGPGYVDLDVDITIKHPLSTHEYDGYDVRGIFVGNGTSHLQYNDKLVYPADGTDQIVLNADGYTRWFNPTEFLVPKLFGYMPGKLASPGYTGTATLNPYRYFGDGLGTNEDLWGYLNSGGKNVGYFLAGTSNTRNYKIRFPTPLPGVKYGYAVVANWSGTAPQYHPSHAPEALGSHVEDNSTLYYIDDLNKGGNLRLDITVFDWDAALSSGVMEDYLIKVESTVLTVPYELSTSEMTPTANGDHWYTYHVEIPADNITGIEGNEMWAIVEDSSADYTNPLGVPNTADGDKIASCFRCPLTVSTEEPLWIQVTSPNGGEQWKTGSFRQITWDANMNIQNVSIALSLNSGADYTQILSPSTFNDGSFTWGPIPAEAVSGTCRIMISDLDNPGVYDTSDADFEILVPGIHVTQPNGGEEWKAGDSGEITWEADPEIATVMIFLSLNSGGSYNNFISFPTPNDGSYMWNPIPASAAGTQDRIRVIDADDFSVYDDSDADFTVTKSSIIVLTPNGGEEWEVGSSQDITWDADPEIQNIRIDLSLNSGFNYSYAITPSVPNTGIFTWDPIPLIAASDNCRIRVGDADVQGVNDASDANFRIFSPWINVTSPNGGESLEAYMNWEITWESSETGGTVYIEYSKDNFVSDVNLVATNTPNDGSFMWENIPLDLSDTVRVRVFSASPSMSDASDADFSIVAPPPFIRVLTPNGGEEWRCGHPAEVTWMSYGITGNVDIDYSRDGFVSDVNEILDGAPNTGSYTWDPVRPDYSDTVLVRVQSTDNPAVFDLSDADLSIVEAGWARTWGDDTWDGFDGVVVDADGNSFVTGDSYDDDNQNTMTVLQKYDPAGQLEWSTTWGSDQYLQGANAEAIAIDDSGYLYVTGSFSGTIDFDPGTGTDIHSTSAQYETDVFLSQFDSDGTWYWTRTWGGTDYEWPCAVAVSGTNVYVAGNFSGADVDFDPDPVDTDLHSSNGSSDAFLSKFDTSGDFVWAGTWGSGDSDAAMDVVVKDTVVFVTGYFSGSADFDPGPGDVSKSSNGATDAYLSWFDENNSFLGVETWGGADNDGGESVAVDGLGNVYITGWFRGADVDFDPGAGTDLRSSNGDSDNFLSKFDASVAYQWVRTWGSPTSDGAFQVDVDGLGNAFVTGEFEGSDVDFDPGPGSDLHSSNGTQDAYLNILDSSGNFVMARTWGGNDDDEANGLFVTGPGAIYVVGFFDSGSVEFAPVGAPCFEDSDIHITNGNGDAFLVKYMPDGCW